jgi:hypothetical protein
VDSARVNALLGELHRRHGIGRYQLVKDNLSSSLSAPHRQSFNPIIKLIVLSGLLAVRDGRRARQREACAPAQDLDQAQAP